MTITWNIDEARATIRAQMAETNRLDEVIDDLSAETSAALARAEAAEAEIERLRAQVATLETLRDELDVTRDMLRSVPEHSAGWYADICDYLETVEETSD